MALESNLKLFQLHTSWCVLWLMGYDYDDRILCELAEEHQHDYNSDEYEYDDSDSKNKAITVMTMILLMRVIILV